jgi:hypothetical protein
VTSAATPEHQDDYLGRTDLLALGIDPATVCHLLRHTPLTGHDGQPVVTTEQVEQLLASRKLRRDVHRRRP